MPSRKGSRNKVTLATEAQIKKLKQAGTDPKDYIIGVMAGTHEFDPIKFRAAEVMMEYCYAKLSRVEMKALIREVRDPTELTDEDLARVAQSEQPATHH